MNAIYYKSTVNFDNDHGEASRFAGILLGHKLSNLNGLYWAFDSLGHDPHEIVFCGISINHPINLGWIETSTETSNQDITDLSLDDYKMDDGNCLEIIDQAEVAKVWYQLAGSPNDLTKKRIKF